MLVFVVFKRRKNEHSQSGMDEFNDESMQPGTTTSTDLKDSVALDTTWATDGTSQNTFDMAFRDVFEEMK